MKQKNQTSVVIQRMKILPVLGLASVLMVGFSVVPRTNADSFDEQIQQLQQDNSSKLNAVSALANQAASYQDAINRLQVQINGLQAQINDNLAQQADLQAKIDANQQELNNQRSVLGENLRVMYVEGQITTIEMLATSKNLSDFVDKEEGRTAVQNKIQDTLKRINDLQNQMKEQQNKLTALLTDQKKQQSDLNASQAQQASLLSFNTGQQAAYNAQIKNNQTQIADLRRQQAVENSRLSGGKVIGGKACDAGDGDTYPSQWCSPPMDSIVDPWGMYNRECVAYTAWKVYESGRHMPYWGGYGNANQWDDNARAEGIPVDTNPRDGDVAIKNAGEFGHALYVEHVYTDGSILVSDYNQQYDGLYRRYTIPRATVVANNLQFIHFP